jgi:sugar lactone lactonase YvrE
MKDSKPSKSHARSASRMASDAAHVVVASLEQKPAGTEANRVSVILNFIDDLRRIATANGTHFSHSISRLYRAESKDVPHRAPVLKAHTAGPPHPPTVSASTEVDNGLPVPLADTAVRLSKSTGVGRLACSPRPK